MRPVGHRGVDGAEEAGRDDGVGVDDHERVGRPVRRRRSSTRPITQASAGPFPRLDRRARAPRRRRRAAISTVRVGAVVGDDVDPNRSAG